MGVILGSAVVPIALCITWSRANKWGCIWGPISGFFSGLIAWLVTTSSLNGGVINVTTSGGDYEMLAGNLASIGVGGIVAVAVSLIVSEWSFLAPESCSFQFDLQWPEDFDFESTRALNVAPRTSNHAKEDTLGDEKVDEKISEKKGNELTETRSVTDDEGPVVSRPTQTSTLLHWTRPSASLRGLHSPWSAFSPMPSTTYADGAIPTRRLSCSC
jgi:hypothetical protein